MIAYSVLTDGWLLPVSIWEIMLADTPDVAGQARRLTPRRSALGADPLPESAGSRRARGHPVRCGSHRRVSC